MKRVQIYGDSQPIGFFLTPAIVLAWATRFRGGFPGNTQIEAYAARRLKDDVLQAAIVAGGPAGLDYLTNKFNRPNVIINELGTNDWGVPDAGYTAAIFGGYYAALLDIEHAKFPGAQIICDMPSLRSDEATANVNGEYLRDFRKQIQAACFTRPWTELSYAQRAATADATDTSDGLHYTNTGTDKRSRYDLSLLGLEQTPPIAYGPSSPAAPLYEQWESSAGITLVAGAVSAWQGRKNGRILGQAIAGKRPTIAAGILNGFDAVRFASASGQFLQQTAASPLANPCSIVAVLRMRAIGASGVNDAVWDGQSAIASLVLATDSTPETFIAQAPPPTLATAFALSTNFWSIVEAVYNGGPGSTFLNVDWGNTTRAVSLNVGGINGAAPNGLTLAALQDGSRSTDVDFVEILAYGGALTQAELDFLSEGYLKPKYAL